LDVDALWSVETTRHEASRIAQPPAQINAAAFQLHPSDRKPHPAAPCSPSNRILKQDK